MINKNKLVKMIKKMMKYNNNLIKKTQINKLVHYNNKLVKCFQSLISLISTEYVIAVTHLIESSL